MAQACLVVGTSDMQGDAVNRSETQWGDVVSAYRLHYELSMGERQERLRSEESDWAYEAVSNAVRDGAIPLTVVDALVCDPDGDSDYRAYVAAGPALG
jgi:hypothetical protein